MEFVNARDLRLHPKQVWQALEKAQELVITLKGRPIGILAKTSEGGVEETLRAFRRARVTQAVSRLRSDAALTGADRISAAQIQKEINAVRRGRRSAA